MNIMNIIEIGNPKNLHFRIEWDDSETGTYTQCFLEIRFGDKVISNWKSERGESSFITTDLHEFVEILEWIRDDILILPDYENRYEEYPFQEQISGFYLPRIVFISSRNQKDFEVKWAPKSYDKDKGIPFQFFGKGIGFLPWDDLNETTRQLRALVDQKLDSIPYIPKLFWRE